MDEFAGILGLFVVSVVSGLLSLIIGFTIEGERWKQELVDKGYAIYCPLDGEWAYKKDGCDD